VYNIDSDDAKVHLSGRDREEGKMMSVQHVRGSPNLNVFTAILEEYFTVKGKGKFDPVLN
jgi:hypothetical protein